MRSRSVVAAVVAVLVAAPLVFVKLGAAPFDDPGEGMHAEIARELLVTRDPFALTLSGVRYVDKPPLLYALGAGAFAAFGQSEWSARLPSALAGLVAVAATAWLGARLAGPLTGIVAGLGLATSVGFFAYARYVRPETLLVATLCVGFALVLAGITDGRGRLVSAGLVAFGLAGLAKDPLAALLPPCAVGLALVLAGQVRPLRRWLPFAGVIGGIAAGFAWWIAAEIRTPGFTWYTVVDNHLLNVVRARHFPDEDVPLGAGEFLTVAVLGAAPWSLAAAATIVGLCRRRAWREPAALPWTVLALWALGVLAVTVLSPFRLPHYGLPAYPALALCAARAWNATDTRRLAGLHGILFAVTALACGLAWSSDGGVFTSLVMGTTDVATRKHALAADAAVPSWEDLRPLLGGAALVFGVGAVAVLLLTRFAGGDPPRRSMFRHRHAAVLAVVATMLAVMPVVATALGTVSTHRAVRPVAVAVAHRMAPADALVHEGPLENSGALEWYAGRRPVVVDGRRSVLGFGATLSNGAAAFWEHGELALAWVAPGRVWLVTSRPPATSVVKDLPDARLVLAAGGRRLYVNR